ncbi:hypothetical protein B0H13DRAFT_1916694 [Mycena leptocephala]|nr:hypothetical protein B0H13DRAFT_1916694 [Mycena leptocephala]
MSSFQRPQNNGLCYLCSRSLTGQQTETTELVQLILAQVQIRRQTCCSSCDNNDLEVQHDNEVYFLAHNLKCDEGRPQCTECSIAGKPTTDSDERQCHYPIRKGPAVQNTGIETQKFLAPTAYMALPEDDQEESEDDTNSEEEPCEPAPASAASTANRNANLWQQPQDMEATFDASNYPEAATGTTAVNYATTDWSNVMMHDDPYQSAYNMTTNTDAYAMENITSDFADQSKQQRGEQRDRHNNQTYYRSGPDEEHPSSTQRTCDLDNATDNREPTHTSRNISFTEDQPWNTRYFPNDTTSRDMRHKPSQHRAKENLPVRDTSPSSSYSGTARLTAYRPVDGEYMANETFAAVAISPRHLDLRNGTTSGPVKHYETFSDEAVPQDDTFSQWMQSTANSTATVEVANQYDINDYTDVDDLLRKMLEELKVPCQTTEPPAEHDVRAEMKVKLSTDTDSAGRYGRRAQEAMPLEWARSRMALPRTCRIIPEKAKPTTGVGRRPRVAPTMNANRRASSLFDLDLKHILGGADEKKDIQPAEQRITPRQEDSSVQVAFAHVSDNFIRRHTPELFTEQLFPLTNQNITIDRWPNHFAVCRGPRDVKYRRGGEIVNYGIRKRRTNSVGEPKELQKTAEEKSLRSCDMRSVQTGAVVGLQQQLIGSNRR